MAVIAAFVLNAVLNFVVGLLIAWLLGPEQFGVFALATAGATVLNTLLFEWLRLSATRFYSGRVREEEPWIRHGLDRAYAVLALGLFAAALICAAFSLTIEASTQSRTVITASAALAAIGIGVFDYHAALARARFDGGLYLRLVAVKNVLAFTLMAGTAWLLPQPVWVLIAAGASQFLAVVLMRAPLRDPAKPALRVKVRQTWRLFLVYGLPLIAANAIYATMPFLNRWTIGVQDGFAEAGYFALAADVTSRALATLGTALDLLLFQLAVRAEEKHGRSEAEAQIGRNAAVVVALMLPSAVGFWAVLPALQALVVPEAYRGPFALYAGLLIPGLFCLALTNFALNPVFQIRQRTVPVIAAALVGLAVNGIGLLLLPPLLGPAGIALAQTLGFAGATILLGVRALTGPERIRLPWGEIAAACVASAAMLLALMPLRMLAPATALALCIPVGIAVYAGLVFVFDIAGLRRLVAGHFARTAPGAAE